MKLFLLILGLALALRLGLSLTYPHYWGVDGGASGETVNYWTGQVDFWNAFPKPPLAPGLLLAPFWLTLGPDVGYKIWASIFSVLPIIPVYLLTARLVSKSAALAMSVFASLDWMWATMFVEGAQPMLAFALLGMCYWAVIQLYEWRDWKAALVLFIGLALIPWTNQTTTALAALTLGALWLTLWALSWHRYKSPDWAYGPKLCNLLQILPLAILGSLIGALALPWYMQTLPGSEGLTYGGPTLFWAWGFNTLQLLVALAVAGFILWKASRIEIKALAIPLIVLAVMAQFLSYDEVLINPLYRARYFMGIIVFPLIAWIAWKYWLPKVKFQWAWGAGAVTAIYMLGAFIFVVYSTADYATMVKADTAEALKLTGSANVATNAFSLSLWTAALNKVESPSVFTAPPPPAYRQQDEDLRCIIGWVGNCNPSIAAQSLDVKYFLADERFPFPNPHGDDAWGAPPNQWEVTANTPWLDLIYEEGTTKLWHLDANGSKSTSEERALSPRR